LIADTEESLQMIEPGQKEAMYFKFIDEATQEKRNENKIQG